MGFQVKTSNPSNHTPQEHLVMANSQVVRFREYDICFGESDTSDRWTFPLNTGGLKTVLEVSPGTSPIKSAPLIRPVWVTLRWVRFAKIDGGLGRKCPDISSALDLSRELNQEALHVAGSLLGFSCTNQQGVPCLATHPSCGRTSSGRASSGVGFRFRSSSTFSWEATPWRPRYAR